MEWTFDNGIRVSLVWEERTGDGGILTVVQDVDGRRYAQSIECADVDNLDGCIRRLDEGEDPVNGGWEDGRGLSVDPRWNGVDVTDAPDGDDWYPAMPTYELVPLVEALEHAVRMLPETRVSVENWDLNGHCSILVRHAVPVGWEEDLQDEHDTVDLRIDTCGSADDWGVHVYDGDDTAYHSPMEAVRWAEAEAYAAVRDHQVEAGALVWTVMDDSPQGDVYWEDQESREAAIKEADLAWGHKSQLEAAAYRRSGTADIRAVLAVCEYDDGDRQHGDVIEEVWSAKRGESRPESVEAVVKVSGIGTALGVYLTRPLGELGVGRGEYVRVTIRRV